MNSTNNFREAFERLQPAGDDSLLGSARRKAMQDFDRMGIPTVRNEEWKYTQINSLFDRPYSIAAAENGVTAADLQEIRLPGSASANELVFVNGIFSSPLSTIRSRGLVLLPLEEAASNEYRSFVDLHFNHSSRYLKDGINALNTAFIHGGVFLHVQRRQLIDQPVYIYNITDTRNEPVLAQPRSLVLVSEQAQVQFVETYATLGKAGSITNQVMEMVVEESANVAYYKIQNDGSHASQVSTTHIRQIGTSVVNTVTISLNGGIVRNNLHAIMEAPHAEAHLYGLYFQRGKSHIDNHTLVDNMVPDCQSNELYKGILDDQATGVFNGKIFVRKDAQKTNAFQSNKNILLSDTANVNTKPQLEIFADDVKCSHGCTVGSLDEDGLFYLQARGIPYRKAIALLLQGFAMDILEKIKPAVLRTYVEELIVQRLTSEVS